MTGFQNHADDLTPTERRRQIAAILADGVRRLVKTKKCSSSQIASESATQGLDVSRDMRLTGHSG